MGGVQKERWERGCETRPPAMTKRSNVSEQHFDAFINRYIFMHLFTSCHGYCQWRHHGNRPNPSHTNHNSLLSLFPLVGGVGREGWLGNIAGNSRHSGRPGRTRYTRPCPYYCAISPLSPYTHTPRYSTHVRMYSTHATSTKNYSNFFVAAVPRPLDKGASPPCNGLASYRLSQVVMDGFK